MHRRPPASHDRDYRVPFRGMAGAAKTRRISAYRALRRHSAGACVYVQRRDAEMCNQRERAMIPKFIKNFMSAKAEIAVVGSPPRIPRVITRS